MPDGKLTESEMDSSGIRNWENKLSEEERARIAIMEWKNDQKIDYKKPLKDYPQIGFGLAGIAAIAIGRALYYRRYKRLASKYQHVEFSQYLIHTRVYAQGFFVVCATSIVAKPVFEYLWKKYVKPEDPSPQINQNHLLMNSQT